MILANFTMPNRFSRALPHPLCGSPLPEGAKDRLKPLPRLFDKPQFENPPLSAIFDSKHPIRRGNVGVSRGGVSAVPDANEDWGA